MSTHSIAQQILDFWFGQTQAERDPVVRAKLWWGKDAAVDAWIREEFLSHHAKAMAGEYDDWSQSPQESLAFVILLDQFSRQIFRDTPEAFASDSLALSWAQRAIEQGYDQQLSSTECVFLYLPFEHSEELVMQERSLQLFQALYDNCPNDEKAARQSTYEFAVAHYEIIKRFGRFPHRNAILRRESTPEEIEFLQQPGSSF